MDIVSHTLSGAAFGTVVAAKAGRNLRERAAIVAIGALGGAIPDVDVISLWSGFDSTIKVWFDLPATGREIYFGKWWYSHHALTHSLAFAFAVPLLFTCLRFIATFIRGNREQSSATWWRNQRAGMAAFAGGCLIHILEDMPTPHSVWGGVQLFWPMEQYVGGTGQIWWWNNYDITLIIFGVVVLNGLVNLLAGKIGRHAGRIASIVFSIGLAICLYQMNTRPVDFNYEGHAPNFVELEIKSLEIQHEILDPKLFELMQKVDNTIPLNF